MRRTLAVMLFLAVPTSLVVGCGGKKRGNDTADRPAGAVSLGGGGGSSEGYIPWNNAAEHIGEYATVEGRVVSAHYASSSRGKPTFLNLGKPYPDPRRFTVVIWEENRDKFDEPPETTYRGKLIRVTGTITTYKGVPRIVVESPEQISAAK